MSWLYNDRVRDFCRNCPDYRHDKGSFSSPPDDVCLQGIENPAECSHHKAWSEYMDGDD